MSHGNELLSLPMGWDSYGASALSPIVVGTAFRFLDQFMTDDMPCPQLVPTSHGGVNVEWHLNDGCDIEVEFHDGAIEALVADQHGEVVFPKGTHGHAVAQLLAPLLSQA